MTESYQILIKHFEKYYDEALDYLLKSFRVERFSDLWWVYYLKFRITRRKAFKELKNDFDLIQQWTNTKN